MIAKTFEIRDVATFIPVLAVKLNPSNEKDRYLLGRAGYGTTPDNQAEYVMLCNLDGGNGRCTVDEYDWGISRTRTVAHAYIKKNFDTMESGAIVDVQFILGETAEPKASEQQGWPL